MTDISLIRRAARSDVAACAKVVNDWIDMTDWMPRAHDPETIKGFIDDAFDGREIWVHGDPVDAYMSFDPVEARIGGLYCAKTGLGIGKAFLDIAKSGRDRVWLSTHEPNILAQRFYGREGFVQAGKIAAEPPETVAELLMEWRR